MDFSLQELQALLRQDQARGCWDGEHWRATGARIWSFWAPRPKVTFGAFIHDHIYTILYHFIPFYTMLYHVIPFYTM